ncbi:SDR family oxidoreductase [Nocardia aurea]|uniref:SDR family oxidoreductase n=1 Tax=Nocardia aurea TaxID=2144174 RepID=UPI00130017B2|nr:SDR family oxidoreductase [Nocardia aurea]
MNARVVILGEGPLAAVAADELRGAGYVVSPDDEATGLAQVLVITDAIDAQYALAAIRRHQDGLAATGRGRVVLVGNRDWLGWPGRAEEAAATAALVGLTRSLALELGPQGTTVNLICPPGPSTYTADNPWAEPPPPLTGPVDDGDVAFAIAFAADERSGYFTGQVLHVSGGLSVLSSLTA